MTTIAAKTYARSVHQAETSAFTKTMRITSAVAAILGVAALCVAIGSKALGPVWLCTTIAACGADHPGE